MINDSMEILTKIGELATSIEIIKTDVSQIKNQSAESHKVLLGNGEPDKGLHNKVTGLEKDVSAIRKDLNLHLIDHEKTERKAFDIIRPIIIIVLTWIVTGGITMAILYPSIQQLLSGG